MLNTCRDLRIPGQHTRSAQVRLAALPAEPDRPGRRARWLASALACVSGLRPAGPRSTSCAVVGRGQHLSGQPRAVQGRRVPAGRGHDDVGGIDSRPCSCRARERHCEPVLSLLAGCSVGLVPSRWREGLAERVGVDCHVLGEGDRVLLGGGGRQANGGEERLGRTGWSCRWSPERTRPAGRVRSLPISKNALAHIR